MFSNALFDNIFLDELNQLQDREIYAKITALTWQELAIESIEGRVSGGSINADGDSAVRRSCSLTLVSLNLNIDEFYWGVRNKFKLEIGVLNNINTDYEDIIWFPQGIFLISDFNINFTLKNYLIQIKGKDKMCLLNGELNGQFPCEINFGVETYHDLETDTRVDTDKKVKDIIKEMVRNYGDELPQNIIINDLDDAGLELLEYRGFAPIYMFREINSDSFTNLTFNEKQECYYLNENYQLCKTTIGDSVNIIYDNLIDLNNKKKPTKVILSLLEITNLSETEFYNGSYFIKLKEYYTDNNGTVYSNNYNDEYYIIDNNIFLLAFSYDSNELYYKAYEEYYIAQFKQGSTPGYRLTDLTYPGDFIMREGETVTAALNKIKTMLGLFEYFYNLDGQFVFQKKKNYKSNNWVGNEVDGLLYNDATLNVDQPIINLLNNKLITSFKNAPKINNIKNDYSVWGTYKTDSGEEESLHARYAIDKKPLYYKSYSGLIYYTEDLKDQINGENTHCVDWREIIYLMALDYRKHNHDDDFLYHVSYNNSLYYPTGVTGYERYYTDLEGFWRKLYNPNPDPKSENILDLNDIYDAWVKDTLYVSNSYRKLASEEKDFYIIDINKLYILNYDYEINDDDKIHSTPELIPFLGSKYCHLNYNDKLTASDDIYFFNDPITGKMNDGVDDIVQLNQIHLGDIYIKERGPFIGLDGYENNIHEMEEELRNIKLEDFPTGEYNSDGSPEYNHVKYFLAKMKIREKYKEQSNGIEHRRYYYVGGYVKPGDEWPEIDLPEEEVTPPPPIIGENVPENTLLTDDNMFFKTSDDKWYVISRDIIYSKTSKPLVYRNASSEAYAKYLYWVFKYPFGTLLGEYLDDYTNYAEQAFSLYLNQYGWDNLYIKDSNPIKFSDLDLPILRLYYKDAGIFTTYLNLLLYDNFNLLKTNYSELSLYLPLIKPSDYSLNKSYLSVVQEITDKYLGLIPNSMKEKNEAYLESLYKILETLFDSEEQYNQQLLNTYNDYINWLSSNFKTKINKPFYNTEFVFYQNVYYDFNINHITGNYWHKMVEESPEHLSFWFDFINGDTSELSEYSIQTIGPRSKVINDSTVKAISYKEVPNMIFVTSELEKKSYNYKTGYNYILLPQEMNSVFVTSSRGKSAVDAIEDLIYQHCYAAKNVNISMLPIYYLLPNSEIYIKNDETKINGNYIISKITIPFELKKTMSITATKIVPSIY